MFVRGLLVLISAASLVLGCASRSSVPPGAGSTSAEDQLLDCRRVVEQRRAQHARADAGRSARTGTAVAGSIARGTLGTWDPFLQIATLGAAAAYGLGAAVIDGGLRAAKRAGNAQDALQACLAEAAQLSPQPASSQASTQPPAPRDGAAELRSLGVEAPR